MGDKDNSGNEFEEPDHSPVNPTPAPGHSGDQPIKDIGVPYNDPETGEALPIPAQTPHSTGLPVKDKGVPVPMDDLGNPISPEADKPGN